MTHHDMKPEHLQQCADAGYEAAQVLMSDSERLAFAQTAISTYLKLNPVWVKASERMPTREDADQHRTITVWSDEVGFAYCRLHEIQPHHLWTSIKHLPPPPDPFEDWLAKQPDDVRSADKELVRKIYNSIKP